MNDDRHLPTLDAAHDEGTSGSGEQNHAQNEMTAADHAAGSIAAAAASSALATSRMPSVVNNAKGVPAAPVDAGGAKIVINPREELTTTMIAASQTLKGSLEGPEGVIVKGKVNGDILVDDSGPAGTGTIVIYEGGEVNGIVSGRRVIVFGTVNGPIVSRTSLTIAETGVVNGDVYYNRMSNNEGGAIEGRIQRIKDGADPLAELRARNG